MKMEQTGCSETSAYKIQTPGNYPEESIQPFIVISAESYSDVPGCSIHADIFHTVPVLVTAVFLKMNPQVRNTYIWKIS